jgi:hypothetical protein
MPAVQGSGSAPLIAGRDYNTSRTHISLEGNAPWPRAGEPTPADELRAAPVLGGLHHTYRRAA